MSKLDNNSKYVFKVVVLIIVIIINIIAILGVVSTVSKTVMELRTNISTGKISKEKSNEDLNKINENDKIIEPADTVDSDETDLNFGNLFKNAIKDKYVLKSIILMSIALILLAIAIIVLIKLK